MAKSMEDATAAMIANLQERTGRTLDHWVAVAKKSGKERHGEIVAHLKGEGLTHGYANLVTHTFLESDAGNLSRSIDLVAQQYAGDKAALKPIYDAIIKTVAACGDFEAAPKKGYVSLRRSKQFAIVQPSTKSRVDLGLNLKGEPASDRLEESGSFNAMVSHRVRIEKPADVDNDVKAWIRKAYESA